MAKAKSIKAHRLGKARALRRAKVEKLLEKGIRLGRQAHEEMKPLFRLTETEVKLTFV